MLHKILMGCITVSLLLGYAYSSTTVDMIRNKSWASDKLEYLVFSDSTASLTHLMPFHVNYRYSLNNDSLVLYDTRQMNAQKSAYTYTSGYCFVIKAISPDSITLQPYRDAAVDQPQGSRALLIDSTQTVTFYRPELLYDTIMDFHKLVFRYYGGCFEYNDLQLIVNSDRTIFCHDVQDDRLREYCQGTINDSLYAQLINHLKTSSISRLSLNANDDGIVITSGPIYKLCISYNDTDKTTEGPFVPAFSEKLFTFLQSLPRSIKLERTHTAEVLLKQYFNDKGNK